MDLKRWYGMMPIGIGGPGLKNGLFHGGSVGRVPVPCQNPLSYPPSMHNQTSSKKSMFVTPDGQNLFITFCLVSSLFLLWGFCNGMIDVMDKHFQEVLHLKLSQSAWVQTAHYLGYFLMSMPAGDAGEQAGI